ncbi:copper resistance protein CopC/CopD [Nocardioides sp. J2M5]|uniref:copper resistance CopC/CopD family protein n=1 Tax=Nocardioides palaemonis TaxID=2829810 RepID=UPI001BAC70DE|nr:copper resistance protein CopC [Nocardioides palaemonis]MBS2939072.1 copper resistance protein CopC/CopD [Nocardioides palaemonis]
MRAFLGAAIAALALLVGAAPPASAHASLVDSDPDEGAVVATAPETVVLTFNEPVRLTSQPIRVYDADGEQVESSAEADDRQVTVALPGADDLADGTYVVAWNALSGDGHPLSGALTFSIGAPSASLVEPPAPESSSRAVTAVRDALTAATYVGLLVAAGLALFTSRVLPTSWSGTDVRRRLRRLMSGAALVAGAAAVLLVPVASVYAQGRELDGLLTSFSPALVLNEVSCAVLVVVGLAVVVRASGDAPPDARAVRLLTGGALLALAGPALVGHTRAYAPWPLLVASDVLHLVAGATWLGGLVGLALAVRALAGREQLAATTLARFSTLAGGLLLLVAATGSFLGWRVVGSWDALFSTTYGRLLLVKVGLALLVAAMGGWNRWRTLPTVRAAAGFADRERAAALLTRTVRIEAVVLVALLATTGVLVNQPPRPEPLTAASGTTGASTAGVGDLRVLAVMSPQRPGANTLLVQVQDDAGDPVDLPAPPLVRLAGPGGQTEDVTVQTVGSGTWRAQVVVAAPGAWEVQVGLATSDREQERATVRLAVAR